MLLRFAFFFLISISAFAEIDKNSLSRETFDRIKRVPEFKFIQEEADKLGVKVYLFGGTASAFAHYVRWDLEREAGDEKYQAERFDYDFTNIYRGNQDLDIVVDGTSIQAAQLQQILKEKYPHFVGSKEAWEVRLLRTQVGDKLPLLDNPDFLNQHTDTNSTGMVAVNADHGEIIFRDLFDWENPDSRFLNDVAAGRIKFLFSDSHETTSRFKEGKNPPVFAAIRYLAKLAQYEVEGFEGDLEIIKRIVEETNWREVKNNSYVRHKLEEFGKKVLLNAPDSEYAWNLLEETGLRKRLIEMDVDRVNIEDSLSWWMSKEPLRTKLVGKGDGKTAAELFKNHINEDAEIVVAHETNSFEAYENITRSSHGAANAFISRKGVSGEAAMLGDGFYTRLGARGARGTNLTIRFKLNPNAREGEDFIYNGDFIVIKNKAALELIQENLNISMVDFLKLIISNSISESDKGLKEKLVRKFNRQSIKNSEFSEAVSFVKEQFFISIDLPEEFNSIFHDLNKVNDFEELVQFLMQKKKSYFRYLVENIPLQTFKDNPTWVERIIDLGSVDPILVSKVLADSYWAEHSYLIEKILEKNTADGQIVQHILTQTPWAHRTDLIQVIFDRDMLETSLIRHVFSIQPYISGHAPFIEELAKREELISVLAKEILNTKEGKEAYTYIVEEIIENGSDEAKHQVVRNVLSDPLWADRGDLVDTLLKEGRVDNHIAALIPRENHWGHRPDWVETLIERGQTDFEIVKFVLRSDNWKFRADWIIEVLGRFDDPDRHFGQVILQSNPLIRRYLEGTSVSKLSEFEERNKAFPLNEWLLQNSTSNCRGFLK